MDWRQWPGKSALEGGGPDHPAAFHMLDVAAVAERLIAPFRFSPALQSAFVLLIGLHDVFPACAGMNGPSRVETWSGLGRACLVWCGFEGSAARSNRL